MKRMLFLLIVIILIVFAFIFSGNKTNPNIERTITWDNSETKDLFYRSCADCHSYETKWPWYSNIAPFSWLIINHVEEGRKEFNISTLDMGEAHEAGEEIQEGKMPIKGYLLLHKDAKLNKVEKEKLINGLNKTFGLESHYKSDDRHKKNHDDDD